MRGIFWCREVGDVGGEVHSVSGAVAAQLQLLLYGNMDFRYSLEFRKSEIQICMGKS